jgi:hypothetical protein
MSFKDSRGLALPFVIVILCFGVVLLLVVYYWWRATQTPLFPPAEDTPGPGPLENSETI